MNDDFADLENELRALELRAASKQLTDRIGGLLHRLPSQRIPVTWWQRIGFNRPVAAICWGFGSPALTVAVVMTILHFTGSEPLPLPARIRASSGIDEAVSSHPPSPAGDVARSNPTESARATNVLYEAFDEGVVLDGGQEPVHRLRYRSAALVEWRNPSTGANWEISYPREDVVLVPIQAQ